ncbi:hypothetical protein GCM10010273_64380 [Streptomyces lavendulocolor]
MGSLHSEPKAAGPEEVSPEGPHPTTHRTGTARVAHRAEAGPGAAPSPGEVGPQGAGPPGGGVSAWRGGRAGPRGRRPR